MNSQEARELFGKVAGAGQEEIYRGLLFDLAINTRVRLGFHRVVEALATEPDGEDALANAGFFLSPLSFTTRLAKSLSDEEVPLETIGETSYGSQILEFVVGDNRHTVVPIRIQHIVLDSQEAGLITATRAAVTRLNGFGHMPLLLPDGAVAKRPK